MEDGRLPLNPWQAPTLRLGEEGSLWLGLRFSTLTVQPNHMEAVKKPKVHAAFQINLTGEASIRILSSSSRNAPGPLGRRVGEARVGRPLLAGGAACQRSGGICSRDSGSQSTGKVGCSRLNKNS